MWEESENKKNGKEEREGREKGKEARRKIKIIVEGRNVGIGNDGRKEEKKITENTEGKLKKIY